MKSLGIVGRLNDGLNPIVVKELRQAVQSKFVVAVLLLFLLIQLVFIGIYLVSTGLAGQLQSLDAEIGRSVFMGLQSILLITCLLFLPAYTGFRLAAERSDTNVDLLFISTLRPRAIIWGKFVAAVVLAVLIFSACTPFMTFTYLLRGIDAPAILLVVATDFLVVLGLVQVAIFLAVIPANWVIKGLLGLVALLTLIIALWSTLAGTVSMIFFGMGGDMESRQFWVPISCVVGSGLAIMSLFYSWSVALINPASANRGLGMRLGMLGVWLATGVLFGVSEMLLAEPVPLRIWACFMGGLCSLGIVIAINEREQWGPRVARSIPRRSWLRLPAFLLYSGSAGGVLFALALFGLTCLAMMGWQALHPERAAGSLMAHAGGHWVLWEWKEFQAITAILLYSYAYALAAVFVRRWLFKVNAVYTWIIMVVLVALGSALPWLVVLFLYRDWDFARHYAVLVSCPFVAPIVAGDARYDYGAAFFLFGGLMGIIVTVLNLPWFIGQIRRFRPYRRTLGPEPPPLNVSPSQMDVTKTAG